MWTRVWGLNCCLLMGGEALQDWSQGQEVRWMAWGAGQGMTNTDLACLLRLPWRGQWQLADIKFTTALVKEQGAWELRLSAQCLPQEVKELPFKTGALGLWHLLCVYLFFFQVLLKTNFLYFSLLFLLPFPLSFLLSFLLSFCPFSFLSPLSSFSRGRKPGNQVCMLCHRTTYIHYVSCSLMSKMHALFFFWSWENLFVFLSHKWPLLFSSHLHSNVCVCLSLFSLFVISLSLSLSLLLSLIFYLHTHTHYLEDTGCTFCVSFTVKYCTHV